MINLRPLYCVSHQIAGPQTAPCRPGANENLFLAQKVEVGVTAGTLIDDCRKVA